MTDLMTLLLAAVVAELPMSPTHVVVPFASSMKMKDQTQASTAIWIACLK